MTALQSSIDQAKIAAKAADEKLGRNIAVIDVSDVMAITDIFVIVSADNERQAAAIVEEIEGDLTDAGFEPKRREGNRENRWVLLDYGSIVVHVQRDAERDFYGLDRLYADCPVYEVEGVPPYEREAAFGDFGGAGDSSAVRGAETIEDLPLAGEGPSSGDDEY
ncbi:ribosome silencing factor [Corynebacterium qintianiae]|uniref:Ribosomal silencing factor RsfS n=1 Tax=Corynebacterium qintianiae TaxID=2709392 RepID=A0A7T0KM30_9CORY|nr:ribosome silencing factor [Corynebacterium qintianiae]QPK82839.1 ribosome silencing factor [Corynebacterium qintianiae]